MRRRRAPGSARIPGAPTFGDYGYFYIRYGAAGIGSAVQRSRSTPPPAACAAVPRADRAVDSLVAGEPVTISWTVDAGFVPAVDIWFSRDDLCFETRLASGRRRTPAAGSGRCRTTARPRGACSSTRRGDVLDGYGFTVAAAADHRAPHALRVGGRLGDTAPYESPATAAHTLAAAVLACTGLDTVLVARRRLRRDRAAQRAGEAVRRLERRLHRP